VHTSALGSLEDTQRRVLQLIQRHGWNATAFQTLEQGYRYFFVADEACVAYVVTAGAWVAAGAPIAREEARGEVALAFAAAARAAGRRCCFFAAEERLLARTQGALRGLHIGEQPVWDPRRWPDTLAIQPSLREQLRRARAKGVTVRKLETAELESGPARAAMTRLTEEWLTTRRLSPMGFLVRLEPFTQPSERACFVAEQGGLLVAFAGVVPVPARAGWFIEDLVRGRSAPNGTTELLIDAVMRWAGAAGTTWITLGLAPLAGDVGRVLRLTRRVTKPLYDFEGVRAFKAKLRPDAWMPLYLAFPAAQNAFVSLLDGVSAFAPGGITRFTLRSLVRRPDLVLGALALLLIPWTVLLALAPAEQWYGSAVVKWSWVSFDVALTVALLIVLKRPTTVLTTALAVAVTCDAILTCVQAFAWNLRHVASFRELLLVAMACSGPSLAAACLWRLALARQTAASQKA
jgi:phosphatidylglycerol lysyltransferase